MLDYLPQLLMLLAISIYSYRALKSRITPHYFNLAVVWAGISLLSFCFSIMAFVVSSIIAGFVYSVVFAVSFRVAMKFRDAKNAT